MSSHTCAIQDGVAKCWGTGDNGRLGNGNGGHRTIPVSVPGFSGSRVTGIAAGNEHSCAIVNGAARCWGSGSAGQLGDGEETSSSSPVQVLGFSGSSVTGIAAGNEHSCAIHDGAAKCWG